MSEPIKTVIDAKEYSKLQAENQRLRELLRDIEYCIPHESEGTTVFLCPFCQSEEGLPHSEKCHYTDSTD